jgi:OOP family OmpA-OmpF porin
MLTWLVHAVLATTIAVPWQSADRTAMTAEVVRTGSVILEGVTFELDRAVLMRGSDRVLEELRAMLLEHTEWAFEVQVHTDESSDPEQARTLSAARADTVVGWLTSRGIARARLVGKGYGSSRPLPAAPAADPGLQHRRVELRKLNEE